MGINLACRASNSEHFALVLPQWLLIRSPKVGLSLGHKGEHTDAETNKVTLLRSGHPSAYGCSHMLMDGFSSWGTFHRRESLMVV